MAVSVSRKMGSAIRAPSAGRAKRRISLSIAATSPILANRGGGAGCYGSVDWDLICWIGRSRAGSARAHKIVMRPC